MVAAEKLRALFLAADVAVRVMQAAADVLRGDSADMARAAMLESAATSLARAVHNAGGVLEANTVPEHLAALLSVAGKSVRAMESARGSLLHHDVAYELEDSAATLARALHEAGDQTVPIAVEDVLAEDD